MSATNLTKVSGLTVASATITAAAAGNYAANDVISNSATDTEGTATLFEFITGGIIVGVRMVCSEDSVVFRGRLHLFKSEPTASEVEMDDNAAFSITTSTDYIGYVDLPAFADQGSVSACQTEVDFPFFLDDGSGLYAVLQTLDAETNETASMTIRIEMYALT